MRTIEALDDEKYRVIGAGIGSDDMATEASEASERWARDIAGLAPYGFGPEAKETFETDRTAHASLRDARPEMVVAKTKAVNDFKELRQDSKSWIEKVGMSIGRLARFDADVALKLKAAYPADESKYASGIGSMAALLTELAPRLPESAQAAARLAEAPGLKAGLEQSPGQVSVAKAAPMADTAAIDILDGKLYVTIKDLNDAARGAIKDSAINAKRSEYRFKHVKKSKPANRGGNNR